MAGLALTCRAHIQPCSRNTLWLDELGVLLMAEKETCELSQRRC